MSLHAFDIVMMLESQSQFVIPSRFTMLFSLNIQSWQTISIHDGHHDGSFENYFMQISSY